MPRLWVRQHIFQQKKQVYVCEDCKLEFAEERPEIQSKTIFFSYAHDENEWLVQKLKGDIEQRGHKVWIDDIGQAFDENFENGITYMRKINAKLADAYKELLSLICEIIIESDGVITESEISEVKRLKAMCE